MQADPPTWPGAAASYVLRAEGRRDSGTSAAESTSLPVPAHDLAVLPSVLSWSLVSPECGVAADGCGCLTSRMLTLFPSYRLAGRADALHWWRARVATMSVLTLLAMVAGQATEALLQRCCYCQQRSAAQACLPNGPAAASPAG